MQKKFKDLTDSNLFLFLSTALIWGTTWIVIIGQFGKVSPEVSIFYRFLISSLIILISLKLFKIKYHFNKNDHLWLFIQGIFNFSLNYIFTYYAETKVTTGLVALTFSLLPYFNAIGMKFIYKKGINFNVLVGMILGGMGLIVIFNHELTQSSSSIEGAMLGIIGTVFASLGNLTSIKHFKKGHKILPILGWSMFYGSIFSLLICLIFQKPLIWDARSSYLYSLLYLAIFGTVIAFLSYYRLVEKIGPAKAAYSSIMIPVVALVISYFFESYIWSWSTYLGIFLCLIGNYLVIKDKQQT